MNLKEFATARGLTIKKVKFLSESLLGFTPDNLSTEQIEILDNNLSNAAKALTSATGITHESENVKLTFKTVGVKTLAKQREQFVNLVQDTIVKTVEFTEQSVQFLESYVPNRLAQSFDNINRNLEAVNQEWRPIDYDKLLNDLLDPETRRRMLDDIELLELEIAIDETPAL